MNTKRLKLRPWKKSDADELFKYAQDADLAYGCGWSPHRDLEESLYCIENILSDPETYAIILRETGKAIGCIALKSPNAICADIEPNSKELGFWIGPPYQGQGLVVEAANAILEHAFGKLLLTCVWCGYYTGNEHSRRAQEKIGFKSHHFESKVPTATGDYRDEHFSCMSVGDWILGQLSASADEEYKRFNIKLIPSCDINDSLGVRLPDIRRIAKYISTDCVWLEQLPHRYLEENLLHSITLSKATDPERCIQQLQHFLPYVDNWAVCDTISPKCFTDGDKQVFTFAKSLIKSGKPYHIRYGYLLLLRHFTGTDFRARHLDLIKHTEFDHYYVRMAIAWYLAEAMVEHFEDVQYYIKHDCPDRSIAKMAIRKGIESFRVSEQHKNELKQLRGQLSSAK